MPSSENGHWIATNQKEVAKFFGVSPVTVRDEWRPRGMPGVARSYPLDEIAQWRHHRDIEGRAVGGDALDQYRHERAKLARLERLEREGVLVEKDVLLADMRQFANLIRQGGEQLGRMFGREAVEAFNESIDDALESLNRIDDSQDTTT